MMTRYSGLLFWATLYMLNRLLVCRTFIHVSTYNVSLWL